MAFGVIGGIAVHRVLKDKSLELLGHTTEWPWEADVRRWVHRRQTVACSGAPLAQMEDAMGSHLFQEGMNVCTG